MGEFEVAIGGGSDTCTRFGAIFRQQRIQKWYGDL
jgi:hypothetical protein